MNVAWYIAQSRRGEDSGRKFRYCAVADLAAQIKAEGGSYRWQTVSRGDYWLVKVRASDVTLQDVAQLTGVTRLPMARLNDPLSSLTNAQKNAIKTKLTSAPPTGLGYTTAELQAALGANIGNRTLGDLLLFVASVAVKPRYDAATDSYIFDGAAYTPAHPSALDVAVPDAG